MYGKKIKRTHAHPQNLNSAGLSLTGVQSYRRDDSQFAAGFENEFVAVHRRGPVKVVILALDMIFFEVRIINCVPLAFNRCVPVERHRPVEPEGFVFDLLHRRIAFGYQTPVVSLYITTIHK